MSWKKDAILRAAVKVYVADGEKWSLDDVASKASCSKTLIIQYFGSKDALLSECFDSIRSRIAEIVTSIPFPADGDPDALREALHRFWQEYFDHMLANPDVANFYFRYGIAHGALPSCGRDESSLGKMAGCVFGDNAKSSGLITDDFVLLAEYIVAMANVISAYALSGKYGKDPVVLEKIFGYMVDGICPKSGK